jgi:hypothetical protein
MADKDLKVKLTIAATQAREGKLSMDSPDEK